MKCEIGRPSFHPVNPVNPVQNVFFEPQVLGITFLPGVLSSAVLELHATVLEFSNSGLAGVFSPRSYRAPVH